jgi:CRP-like cAMP-binding protein
MSDEEVDFIGRFKVGGLRVDRGTTILMEGSSSPQLFTVLNGMGLRHRTLGNGCRQVVNLVLPGDFLGLQAGLLGDMRHSVEGATALVLCVFNRAALWNLFRARPEPACDLTRIAAVEEHFPGKTLTTLGQRDATRRLAWARRPGAAPHPRPACRSRPGT